MSTWHGLIGPAEFLLPDEEDSEFGVMAAFLVSGGMVAGTYIGNMYGTYLDYKLTYHAATGNYVRREILRTGVKKAGQATVWRGLGIAAVAHPFSAFLIGVTMMAYSLPPSGNPRGNIMPGDIRYTHIPEN